MPTTEPRSRNPLADEFEEVGERGRFSPFQIKDFAWPMAIAMSLEAY